MAVHDGQLFLREQLDSILPQLNPNDELVISDDESNDQTLEIIKSYQDSRIRVLPAQRFGNPSTNFEYVLNHCQNEIIFLSDQDDIWHREKIKAMSGELANSDLVVCDCRLIDQNGEMLVASFFEWNQSQGGIINNILRNSFVGCCMAFHSRILKKILPFPSKNFMHDQWIGLMALRHFEVKFLQAILVDHRKHERNYSTTGGRSKSPWNKKVISRFEPAKALLQH